MWINERLKSFQHAIRGLVTFFRTEPNARIHLAAAITVIAVGLLFGLEKWEWVAVILCIGLVVVAEALNTSIEAMCDLLHPDTDTRVKSIKDIAAGAVFFASLIAVAVALIIFLN